MYIFLTPLIPVLRRQRQANLCESESQPGLHREFQDNQSSIERPYLKKNKLKQKKEVPDKIRSKDKVKHI